MLKGSHYCLWKKIESVSGGIPWDFVQQYTCVPAAAAECFPTGCHPQPSTPDNALGNPQSFENGMPQFFEFSLPSVPNMSPYQIQMRRALVAPTVHGDVGGFELVCPAWWQGGV